MQEVLLGSRRVAVAVAGAVVAALALAGGLASGRPRGSARPRTAAPIASRYALAAGALRSAHGPALPASTSRPPGWAPTCSTPETGSCSARGTTGSSGPRQRARRPNGTAVAKGGQLTLRRPGGPIIRKLTPASGCKPFPEAQVDATGQTFKGTNRHGHVFGFVDDHLHITANMRGGGLLISGEPFDRFGIAAALGQRRKGPRRQRRPRHHRQPPAHRQPGRHPRHPRLADVHRLADVRHPDPPADLLRVAAARVGGGRAAGGRADRRRSALCQVEPRKLGHSCDETASIVAQIHTLRQMQDYIDAQSGGPGRGWFRLVYSPAQARRVIAQGKLAVIIGIESSDLFGCSELRGKPQCTRADIVRGIRTYKRLGVRGMFVAHWFNNALSGAALEEGDKGIFINLLNRFQTGSYFKTGACPGQDRGVPVVSLPTSVLVALSKFFPATKKIAAKGMPTYPSGLQCNPRGLTALGRFAIEQMIKAHMLIEVDHLSQSARDTVLVDRRQGPLSADLEPQRHRWRVEPGRARQALQARWLRRGDTDGGAGARGQDPEDGELPRPLALLRRRDRHRHGRPVVAARPARRRGTASIALPVQVIRRQGHIHARGHGHAHV